MTCRSHFPFISPHASQNDGGITLIPNALLFRQKIALFSIKKIFFLIPQHMLEEAPKTLGFRFSYMHGKEMQINKKCN